MIAKPESNLLTTLEAAAYLRCGRTMVYVLARRHCVKRIKIGRKTLWRRCDVDKIIEKSARRK